MMSSPIALFQGSAICAEPIEVSVKNTFVHIVEDAACGPKRPSSLPPSMRLSSIERDAKVGPKNFLEIDVSTEASEDDAFSEVGSSSAGDSASAEESESPAGRSKLSSSYISEPRESRLSSSAKAWEPAVPEPPLGIRLRTSAMAWSPSAPAHVGAKSRIFSRHIKQVLTTVKSILVSCLWIESVDCVENNAGFSIVVTMPARHFNRKEDVIKLAKAALLQASEQSSGIYMMGYQAQPFLTMPMGFAALFADVLDEHRACWGMLQTGFCHYGNRCHWEHPSINTKVDVKIKLPDIP